MLTQLAQYNDGYNMMNGNDWGWGLLMMTFWILVVSAIVVLIVRGTYTHDGSDSNPSTALDIAKQRYAKGEINKNEFEQMKKDLQ